MKHQNTQIISTQTSSNEKTKKPPNQYIGTQSLPNDSSPCPLVRAGITSNRFCLFVCWPQTEAHFINEAGSGETVQKGHVSQLSCSPTGAHMVVEGLSLCWPSPQGQQCEQVLPVPVPGVSALRCWSVLLLRRWHQITMRDSHGHFCNSAFLQTENYIQFIVLWQEVSSNDKNPEKM